jgi:hypothetical protein
MKPSLPGGVAARARAECYSWCEVERGGWVDGRATISCQPVAAVVRGDLQASAGSEQVTKATVSA